MTRHDSKELQELESAAMRLDPSSRASLAKALIDSLDDLSDEQYQQLWTEEAEARYADFLAGRTTAIDGDEVLARARARNR
jgi:putative addiction module component (TIGR02574 family)